jgi:NADH-quinone oxidoreductase subunit A
LDERSTLDLLYVAAFFIGGLGFGIGPFIIATLMAPRGTRNISQKTHQLIECGVPPIGYAWIRYSAMYYLYALIFLAFDVDVLFLFPVAMAYDQVYAIREFVEIDIIVGILSLALVYAWKKGVFEWKRKTYNRQ